MRLLHVTPARNLERILREGLVPRRGPRSRELGEPDAAVCCFASLEDAEQAVGGWLGDAFAESTRLVLLAIDVPADVEVVPDAWERQVRVSIPPAAITVLDRDFGR